MRLPGLALCLGLALVPARACPAQETVTDANIVTGFDISDSITGAHMRLQITGLAQAIRAPDILAAIRRGRQGRIGFAVFAWHHRQIAVVPWTVIGSERDAEAVARVIEGRLRVDANVEVRKVDIAYIGRLTDLSRAIDHAAELLATAPFAPERSVVNIIGNGKDNMGEEARDARDRIVATGAVVNGVVLDGDPEAFGYFRDAVIGGPGAFLMQARSSPGLAELMRRKFLRDLVAADGGTSRSAVN